MRNAHASGKRASARRPMTCCRIGAVTPETGQTRVCAGWRNRQLVACTAQAFSGAIDPSSVSSGNVYLINLGDTLGLRGFGQRVGINQTVWDPTTNTLVAQADELLQEHSRYLSSQTACAMPKAAASAGRFNDDVSHGLYEYDRDLRNGVRGGRSTPSGSITVTPSLAKKVAICVCAPKAMTGPSPCCRCPMR